MLPRSLVILALFLAANASANPDVPKTRKTVAHWYQKPHARFVTTPHVPPSFQQLFATSHATSMADIDPYDVARDFIQTMLPNSEEYGYRIRDDSYTDKTTGVTHVYAKQIFRGLDVADGDVNLNILDGVVISHGNEFFHPDEIRKRDQIPLIIPDVEDPMRASDGDGTPAPESNLARAVLNLLKMVTPSVELSTSIESSPSTHLENISVQPEFSLIGSPEDPDFTLKGVPGTASDVKARLVWHQTPKGLELGWKVHVELTDNFYEATLSASNPEEVFSVVDWVSDSSLPLYAPTMEFPPVEGKKPSKKPSKPSEPVNATDAIYLVFPWGVNDPTEGNRSTFSEVKSADKIASPLGWHTIPVDNVPSGMIIDDSFAPIPDKPSKYINFSTTVGNNVFAQENFEGRNAFLNNYRPIAEGMNFTFEYAPVDRNDTRRRMEEAQKHINATVTQLFYTSNAFHDLMYRYGFDEVSGNFQQYNFDRGGRENDGVIANAQDGSGFNNANFMTAPDGQNGRMRMYLWNTASPYRDGDMEAGIVIHELAHGLSTRLTGGPMDSTCLGFGESGGMGEGWGDFLATTIRSSKNYSDFTMGAWAANQQKGIRNYPYSLNLTVNPETYKSVDRYFGVHPIGEVWAEMLWVVENRLIAKHGFTESLFPPAPLENGTIPKGDFYRTTTSAKGAPIPKHGNSLTVQLVINGMKLQPCRPGFLDARDAIIQADQILTDGENFCDIWIGFAERGLGVDAKVVGKTPWGGGVRTNGFGVPRACLDQD